MTDLVELLAQQHRVTCHMCQGHWIPVGTPWDVLTASAFLLERNRSFRPEIHPEAVLDGCDISGWVHIGRARVGRGSRIVGPAFLGDGVTVGNGCTIEHSVLETGAVVGDGCALSHSVLMGQAWLGSGCVLYNSVLDEGASVGNRAVLAAQVFDEVAPVAHTAGLLDRDMLLRRGVVVGPGVAVPAGAVLEPGSILFP